MEATAAWQVPVEAKLPLRYWDGDYVVYNPLTGNTHVLDIVAGKVLEIIMAGPATSARCWIGRAGIRRCSMPPSNSWNR